VKALVVGLGSSHRGDDASGPEVVAEVAALRLPDVEVMVMADPAALLDLPRSVDLLVLVDAMRSGAAPGQVAVLTEGELPPGTAANTHELGLADVIELARALDRVPPRLVIVAIEAAHFDHGMPMSSAVQEAVPAAVRTVVEVLGAAGG
jgi:hydrogenase maturation protease